MKAQLLGLMLIGIAAMCWGQQNQTLNQLKSKYEAKLRDLDQAHDKAIAEAPTLYRRHLEELERRLIDQGNLIGVLAVRDEMKRLTKSDGKLSPSNLASAPKELRDGQQLFLSSVDRAEHLRLKERERLSRAYLQVLEDLKVSLTKEARIDDAVLVANEAERVRSSVLTATELLATKESRRETISPGSPQENRLAQTSRPTSDSADLRSSPDSISARTDLSSLRNGLVLYYDFNQDFGKFARNAIGGNPVGTIKGAKWVNTGRYRGAYSFDGADGYILIPAHKVLAVTNHSISIWINMAEFTPDHEVIFSTLSNPYSTGGIQLAVDCKSRTITYDYRTPTDSTSVASSAQITDRTLHVWTHLAATYDYTNNQAVVHIYINGTLVKTDTRAGLPVTYNNQPGFIGINDDSTVRGGGQRHRQFAGTIDELRLYNRALSSNEAYRLSRLSN